MDAPRFDSVGWLAAIVDSSDDAIFSMDLQGTVTSWNAAAARMFGYQPDEMVNQSIHKLIPPERQGEEGYILGLVRKGERIRHYNTMRRCKDGRLLNVSLTVSPVFDSEGRIVGVSKIARDITEWKIVQETQLLLLKELNHRSKNLLAVADAIVRQTASKGSRMDIADRISRRLLALSMNQDLLIARDWRGVDLKQLVEAQLTPIVDDMNVRVKLEGEQVIVNAAVAQSIALAVYELGANALKFGSLSVPDGKVQVSWEVTADAEGASEFKMTWRESGGPRVGKPRRRGFGSTIIEDSVGRALHGQATATYHRSGFVWELTTNRADILLYTGRGRESFSFPSHR